MRLLKKNLLVNEIFSSIQGESTYAGEPFVFIRLTGCNLRCRYCDTQYAWESGTTMSIDDIIRKTKGFRRIRKILITGGEPLLQKNTKILIKELVKAGYLVLVETNGSLSLKGFPSKIVFIMDIKTPSSQMSGHNLLANLQFLRNFDELKFVISGKTDYLWSVNFLKKHRPKCRILFSPVEGKMSLKKLAQWILKDGLAVRLQPRLHKLINIR